MSPPPKRSPRFGAVEGPLEGGAEVAGVVVRRGADAQGDVGDDAQPCHGERQARLRAGWLRVPRGVTGGSLHHLAHRCRKRWPILAGEGEADTGGGGPWGVDHDASHRACSAGAGSTDAPSSPLG
jgi:hypothetical protein